MKKILVMGLPTSGKTTLASKLTTLMNAKHLNNNNVRKESEDWDFSLEGRLRQANRMLKLAEKFQKEKYVIIDFICPVLETRKIINADYIVWMDTIKEGPYSDTNKMFQPPKNFDFRVTEKNADKWAKIIVENIKN